jgi:hypothetical protein
MSANAVKHRPASTVITLDDPDNMPVSSHAEEKGRVEWRTESHNYPDFEIQFVGKNPEDDTVNLKRKGNVDQPVVMQIKKTGDYHYKVQHIKKDGTVKEDPRTHILRGTNCIGC